LSTFEKSMSRQIFEVDEITTDDSLSTNMSPTTKILTPAKF
jgi:hypothetical protein